MRKRGDRNSGYKDTEVAVPRVRSVKFPGKTYIPVCHREKKYTPSFVYKLCDENDPQNGQYYYLKMFTNSTQDLRRFNAEVRAYKLL
jgi:hypothetical protein